MRRQHAALLLALCLCVAAVAAGCSAEESPIVGKWTMSAISVSGVTMNLDEAPEELTSALGDCSFDFKADGNVTATMAGTSGSQPYTVDGNTVTIEGEGGQTMTGTYDESAGTLTLDIGPLLGVDGEIVLTKS